jgi:formylglycine-generating enzyme required for sulfatase activity
MEKTPVTNKEYLLFSKERSKSFVIETEKEQHPVVNITWFEAQAYADWGSLRLPSEVEWEIAASRPSGQKQDIKKRKYPWNGSFAENRCNTRANNLGTTTPVGRFSPQGDSFCGCVDMAGNVWEWTNSLFRAYPYRAENENENSDETGSRVIRGGSFRTGPAFATCTARQSFNPYGKKDDLGFRCALKLPDVNEWIESEIINE